MTRSHAHRWLAVAAATVAALAAAGRASSASVTVPNNGDPVTAGAALVAAVQAAGAGDTIVLSAGDYNMGSTLELTKNVTIAGPASPPGARLDGGGLTGPGTFTGGRTDLLAIAAGTSAKLQHLALIGTGTDGTAVDVFGILDLEDSLVGPNAGLAVAAEPGASVSIVNSTISDNGSGLYADTAARVSLASVTLAANRSGGIFNAGGGQVDVTNTIVAGNGLKAVHGKDCEKPIGSDGALGSITASIDGDGTCGASIHADPRLDGLADNGGPSFTRALAAGSPAIDSGGSGCPGTDQRGAARVGTCDIGAFEYGASAARATVAPAAGTDTSGSGSAAGSKTGGRTDLPASQSHATRNLRRLSGSGTVRLRGREAAFEFRATAGRRTGFLLFKDRARGIHLRTTTFSSLSFDSGARSATVRGVARSGAGKRRTSFTIRVSTRAGGSIRVTLSNGYAASGNVVSGSLSITA